MELNRKLEGGFHTLNYAQWTGKPDTEKLFGKWYVDVRVVDGRITHTRFGFNEWEEADLPAYRYTEDEQ